MLAYKMPENRTSADAEPLLMKENGSEMIILDQQIYQVFKSN